MKTIIALMIMASFGANAAVSLDSLESKKNSTTKACLATPNAPSRNMTELLKTRKICETAQIYQRAYRAHNLRDRQARHELYWYCKGVEIDGLEERLLACNLAIAINNFIIEHGKKQ